jgi:hypothetical protein
MSKLTVAYRKFALTPKNFNVSKNDTLNFSVLFCYKISSVATTAWSENEVHSNPDSAPLFGHRSWWLYIYDGGKSEYLIIGISVYRLSWTVIYGGPTFWVLYWGLCFTLLLCSVAKLCPV